MDSISINDQEANHGDAILEKSQSHVGRVRLPQEEVINLKASVEKPTDSSTVKIKPKIDFSIEAILSSRPIISAPSTIVVSSSEIFNSESKSSTNDNRNDPQFSWVYCTRYRPPKLPRKKLLNCSLKKLTVTIFFCKGAKREINLRNRYRNPRIPFSTTEVGALERKFLQSPYLGSNDVNELAAALNMSPKRVWILPSY